MGGVDPKPTYSPYIGDRPVTPLTGHTIGVKAGIIADSRVNNATEVHTSTDAVGGATRSP